MALHIHTISRLLHQTLMELMRSPNLKEFYLADASALSLQYGHRHANEIDLYTAIPYSESELNKLKSYLHNTFGNGEHHQFAPKGNGTSFFLYNLNKDYVKVDIYYSEPFIEAATTIDNIRFAGPKDVMALKLEQIRRGGSKSDFWDLHYLIGQHSLETVLAAHKERYPEKHQKNELRKKLTDFQLADDDFDPPCLLKKDWNLVKLDLLDAVKALH